MAWNSPRRAWSCSTPATRPGRRSRTPRCSWPTPARWWVRPDGGLNCRPAALTWRRRTRWSRTGSNWNALPPSRRGWSSRSDVWPPAWSLSWRCARTGCRQLRHGSRRCRPGPSYARERVGEARRGCELQARSAHMEAKNAMESYRIELERLATQQARLEQQERRLAAGLVSELEVRQNRLQTAQARLTALQARHAVVTSLLELRAATMVDLPGPYETVQVAR